MSGRSPQISISPAELADDPHPLLARLRRESPVAWLPELDAWLVTGHALAARVMLDPGAFTVDDPRFSTQQVVGPSMLSLDGLEHKRHRDPFGPSFRGAEIRLLERAARDLADRLVSGLARRGSGDLRSELAGPLAVELMADILDLGSVDVGDVLFWYEEIVAAVHTVTEGGDVPESGLRAFAQLSEAVAESCDSSSLLSRVARDGDLSLDEMVSNVAVLLFGGIVTSESSMAIAFHQMLADPVLIETLRAESSLIAPFVDESLRIEPSAAAVDRYATNTTSLGDVLIPQGDLVRVSLSAANRDPAVFASPDRLDLSRPNPGKSLTFARGPHACLGVHLARLEMRVATEAVLDGFGHIAAGDLPPIRGLVFRAPSVVPAEWF